MVTINPNRGAGLDRRSYGQGVAVERDTNPKLVIGFGIGGLHIGLLAPGPVRAGEDIDRATEWGVVVPLIAINPNRGTSLTWHPHGQSIACKRDTKPKSVIGLGIGGLKIALLYELSHNLPRGLGRIVSTSAGVYGEAQCGQRQ